MSNQYYRRNVYQQDDTPDYGRRYRRESAAEANSFDDSFDVNQSVDYSRQQGYHDDHGYQSRQQGYYDDRGFQPRQQGYYDDRGYQQRQQGYYDDRVYQERPRDYYDDRYVQPRQQDYRRRDGYGDSYDGYDRQYETRRKVQRDYDDRYDYRPQKAPKKRTSGVIVVVRVIAIIMLLVGGYIIGTKLYSYYTANKGHSDLQALSEDFDQLYAMNGDFFGWLKIDDTEIDYPVMYTPWDPEHYLHTDFNGDYSESGELFVDADIDPSGYHYLIYGHHMFNGSMFGSLPDYADTDYYNAHRTFRFDTMSERGEYEVFAVFYSQVYDEYDDVFKYYNYANLDDEGTYNYYVSNVKAMSIYDTGVTPYYGEKIVTLSTCNYHTDDGRFVVCAKKIS